LKTINRFKCFRNRAPSPKGEDWDEGKIKEQELIKRFISLIAFIMVVQNQRQARIIHAK